MSNKHPGWQIEYQMGRPFGVSWNKYGKRNSRKELEKELEGFAKRVEDNLWKDGRISYRIVELE